MTVDNIFLGSKNTYDYYTSAIYAGTHIILDLYGIDNLKLINEQYIKDNLLLAAKEANATVLFSHFHKFAGEGGVTGVVILSESHISVHTYPETNYAAIDIFMCGTCEIDNAVKVILDKFSSKNYNINMLYRGIISSRNTIY